jgi:hypothetical protein
MRALLIVALVSACLVAGCQHGGVSETLVSPTAIASTVSGAASAEAAGGSVAVPFHSDLTWTKVTGSDVSLCTHPLPAGKVYLQRNTQMGIAVSTHLGTGEFVGHTCVYGSAMPQGWFADYRWTAANGDELLATSEFQYWTGQPGKSVAVDKITFRDGGSGRFEFAQGEGMAYINAPERTAAFEAILRYGKKEK